MQRISKSVIGSPTNFRHIGHIGPGKKRVQELEINESIQQLSISEVIEIYYLKLRNAMDNAVSQKKDIFDEENEFKVHLLEENDKDLKEFCNANEVPRFSIALAELLTSMERYNEKKVPEVKVTAIYNCLLRLEKAIYNTSTWELFGDDCYEPCLELSTFEVNMIEEQMSTYIVNLLGENSTEAIFFPLIDPCPFDIEVKWKILKMISKIPLIPQGTIYKQKLQYKLKERLKNEVILWLNKEMKKLKFSGEETAEEDVRIYTEVLENLLHQINSAMEFEVFKILFEETRCCYFETVTETVDELLFPVSERVLQTMDSYQDLHKDFEINIKISSSFCHVLYLQLKKLSNLLKSQSKIEHLKLDGYNKLFANVFKNMLQVYKLEFHKRIERALEKDMTDTIHYDGKILNSSVMILNCTCTVTDEWKHLEIDDRDMQIAFLVKITEIICDGIKVFADSLECRLQLLDTPIKDLEILKKVCILANSIDHVLHYLQKLPQQMLWSMVLEDEDDSTDSTSKEKNLNTLKLVHESMNKYVMKVVTKMLNVMVDSIYNFAEKPLTSWLKSQTTNQTFGNLQAYLNEILESLHGTLKENLFTQLISHLWSFLIKYIQTTFQEGQSPEYARCIKENVLTLHDFLEPPDDSHTAIFQILLELLDVNSKTTEDLLLDYYTQIAETIVSPVEYLGHIAFQAGYKTCGDDIVNLFINVQKGQRLPGLKLKMSQLTVKVELCPAMLFPSFVPQVTLPVTKDLDNPVFDANFEFCKIPLSLLSVKGAALQVLVLNQDFSYSAEAILLLKQVQNMSGFISLDFLPVYLMQLRKFDMSHMTYKVLENRSHWDKNAKSFIKQRAKLKKKRKKFPFSIPGKKK